ncbi:MAG TPA: GNA1162 family protein, partial [Planctomycetota bacterium]
MRWLAAVALAALAAGCAPGRIYLDRDVATAVVLVPLNDSMNVDAPWKMWKYVEYEVSLRGYALVPHEVVEKFYRDKKFTGDPGQIKAYDSKDLAKIFNADAVVWSNVAEWG